MSNQQIQYVSIYATSDGDETITVGYNGVTRIEKYRDEIDLVSYVRVWKGDDVHAEFCQRNILGVYYFPREGKL